MERERDKGFNVLLMMKQTNAIIDIFVRDYYINVLFEHIPELRNGSCYKLKGLFLIG